MRRTGLVVIVIVVAATAVAGVLIYCDKGDPEPKRATDVAAWEKWKAGDKKAAVAELRTYADVLAGAPGVIRERVDAGFATDSEPWLAQTELYGRALQATADGLDGRRERFTESAELVKQLDKELKLGDGTLDKFLTQAPNL